MRVQKIENRQSFGIDLTSIGGLASDINHNRLSLQGKKIFYNLMEELKPIEPKDKKMYIDFTDSIIISTENNPNNQTAVNTLKKIIPQNYCFKLRSDEIIELKMFPNTIKKMVQELLTKGE